MPRLRSLVFSDMDDIPLTKILSYSPLMQHIEFNSFTTSHNDSEIDLGTLPQIQGLAIIFWDISNLASSTSLGAYLKEKGSHIESLSIGMFFEDRSRIPCTMDLFPTLKPSLRQVRFDSATLQSLIQNPPLRFNELPNLTTLFFIVDLKYVPWSVFHHFLDQHIELECLPPTLAEVYVQVDVLGERSLSFSNSMAASTGNPRPLVLPSNWQICLHVGICINKGNGGTEGSATKRIFERYDELQKAIESQLCMWSQADQLRVTRHYGSNIPW
ncbi:hypothetical protein DL96DRAFT_1625669 [Flagelloscypha sp. PMI_526]|nr:hypothetical protein DL96DRAFT_1625669 [Flagelloscypha sp. PMI_526]